MQKKWVIKDYDKDQVLKLKNDFKLTDIMSKLLLARDVKYNEIDKFLNGTLKDIKDPYLLKDMNKLVDRIDKAIQDKEKICIYGDYDVDGITSITIMYQFLSSLGADVTYYLPDRLIEGYGVNTSALDVIKKRGVSLVITVDCGITAVEETKYAKSIGLDICITDHHECAEILPDAIAIVNPKQKDDSSEYKFHAGVGVAFKCLMALSKKYGLSENSYLKYLDIVAIGTISDIVALTDENRIISKYGLAMIKNTQNIGLKALIELLDIKEIDSTAVSFSLAPRINACGRMGKAGVAVELLLEKDIEKAKQIAITLDELNTKRQEIEKEIFENAIDMINSNGMENKKSIVLYNKSWHNGVIGIVASKLVNMYQKPVILLTKENNVIRGSGRCQQGISLYDSLTKCKDTLIQFGGHELAAGLSIEEENLQKFIDEFEKVIFEEVGDKEPEQIIDIDMQIFEKDLNVSLIKDLYKLRPYGQSNKVPQFLYKGLKITAIRTLKDDKHLKLTLKDNKFLLDALAFSQGNRRDELRLGDKIDVVCSVEVNTFTSPRTIQLILQDFKKSVENV
ncbi:exonuclease RecJ [Clostridium sp. CAG:921]|nr:exonuclease RecJ [Clostridium sp. CAG:921]